MLLILGAVGMAATSAPSYPVPASLPPHSWNSVASKLFIHGCKATGKILAIDHLFMYTSGCIFPPPSLPPTHPTDLLNLPFAGLLNETELALAAKFPMLTVEKGQGLELPGYADDKMTALAAQWKQKRRDLNLPEGWAMCVMMCLYFHLFNVFTALCSSCYTLVLVLVLVLLLLAFLLLVLLVASFFILLSSCSPCLYSSSLA